MAAALFIFADGNTVVKDLVERPPKVELTAYKDGLYMKANQVKLFERCGIATPVIYEEVQR